MSLDTDLKRGSAILLTIPFRPWIAVPSASVGDQERASIIKLCTDVYDAAPADTGTAYYTGLNPVFFGGML
jgi:hypothetical protein